MALRLVVYDPPAVGFPYLVIVLESEPGPHVLRAEACAGAIEAQERLMQLGELLERTGVSGLNAEGS